MRKKEQDECQLITEGYDTNKPDKVATKEPEEE